MSGSGGGGSWSSDSEIACIRLRFKTQIATPQANTIGLLHVGSVLDVTVMNMGGAVAVAVFLQGALIGGLAGGLVNRLRECLLGGTRFKATVQAINGPQILVEIEPF